MPKIYHINFRFLHLVVNLFLASLPFFLLRYSKMPFSISSPLSIMAFVWFLVFAILALNRFFYSVHVENNKLVERSIDGKRELMIPQISGIYKRDYFYFPTLPAPFRYYRLGAPAFKNDKYPNFPKYDLPLDIVRYLRNQNVNLNIDPAYLELIDKNLREKNKNLMTIWSLTIGGGFIMLEVLLFFLSS